MNRPANLRLPLGHPGAASRTKLAAILMTAISLGLAGGVMGVTYARYNAITANRSNSFSTIALNAPGTPTSLHASATSGTVNLTWTAPSSPVAGEQQLVQRAPDSGGACGIFSSVATLASTATTYSDTAASYNNQYCYQVVGSFDNWTQASGTDMALSLPPTSGTDSTSGATLYAVKFIDSTHGWAVGAVGTILSTTNGGTTWTAQTSGTTSDLYGVFFVSASVGWAVGQGGVILATANGGTTWVIQASGTTNDLQAVAFADATHGWVVGKGGVIRASNGTATTPFTWATQTSGTTNDLYGITAMSTSAWAVGQGGVIRYNSANTITASFSWTTQGSGTTSDLRAVAWAGSGNGGQDLVAVGLGGVSVTSSNSGVNWGTLSTGLSTDLYAVSSADCKHTIAVGQGGKAQFLSANNCNNGSFPGSWSAKTSPGAPDLRGISYLDSTHAWAVGQGRTIALTTDSGTSWTQQAYTLSAGDLTALSTLDGSLYTTGTWPSGALPASSACSGSFLKLAMSPSAPTGPAVTTVKATLTYKSSVSNASAQARLQVSGNNGTSYTTVALPAPTTTLTTNTVDISSVINSTLTLQQASICFEAAAGSGAIFSTSLDMVQIQVN